MIELSYPAFVLLNVLATIGGITLITVIVASIIHLTKKD